MYTWSISDNEDTFDKNKFFDTIAEAVENGGKDNDSIYIYELEVIKVNTVDKNAVLYFLETIYDNNIDFYMRSNEWDMNKLSNFELGSLAVDLANKLDLWMGKHDKSNYLYYAESKPILYKKRKKV